MQTEQIENEDASGQSLSNAGLERSFEAWWKTHGQFHRAGGGQYEKTFAYHAWMDSATAERVACELRCAKTAVLLDGHHEYTALKVQEMMMNAVSLRSNKK